MESSKPVTRKVLIFSCKFCGQEFLEPKKFIEHKKQHLAATGAADLERKNEIQVDSTLDVRPPEPIPHAAKFQDETSIVEEQTVKVPEASTVNNETRDEEEEQPTSTSTAAEIQFKLPLETSQTWPQSSENHSVRELLACLTHTLKKSSTFYKSDSWERWFGLPRNMCPQQQNGISIQLIEVKKHSFLADPDGGPDINLMAGQKVYLIRTNLGAYLKVSTGRLVTVVVRSGAAQKILDTIPPSQDFTKEEVHSVIHSILRPKISLIPPPSSSGHGNGQQGRVPPDLAANRFLPPSSPPSSSSSSPEDGDGDGGSSSSRMPIPVAVPPSYPNADYPNQPNLQITNERNSSSGDVTISKKNTTMTCHSSSTSARLNFLGRVEGDLSPDGILLDNSGRQTIENENSVDSTGIRNLKLHTPPTRRTASIQAADIHVDYPCSICGKMMKGIKMPGHRRVYHPEVKPFKCFQCPYESSKSYSLWMHRKRHRTKSEIECSYCTASYDTPRGLGCHLTRVHSVGRKSNGDKEVAKSRVILEIQPKTQYPLTKNQIAFKCRFCGKVFSSSGILYNHELCHTRPYRCNRCPYTSGRITDLRNHKMRRHKSEESSEADGKEWRPKTKASTSASSKRMASTSRKTPTSPKELRCRFCPRVCPNPSSLQGHENCHIRPYKCIRCHHRFGQRKDQIKHEARGYCPKIDKIHQSPSNCPKCDGTFPSNGLLVQHLRLRHPGFKPYKCKECPYGSFIPRLVERHATVHSVRNEFNCPHCTASFCTHFNREKHVRDIHGGGKTSGGTVPFRPQPKSAEAKTNMALQLVPARRAAMHPPGFYSTEGRVNSNEPSPEKPGRASNEEVCKERTSTGGQSVTPPKKFEGNWGLQCPHCDYTSFNTASMRNHISRVHSGEGRGTFNCSDCTASYINKIGLETHRKNAHPQQNPQVDPRPRPPRNPQRSPKPKYADAGRNRTILKCGYCDAKFTDRSKHKYHEYVHTRPFKCHVCHDSFSRKTNLELHLRTSRHLHNVRNSGIQQQQPSNVRPNRTSSSSPSTTHQASLPRKTFACTICKEEFSRMENLQAHAQLDCGETRSHGSSTRQSGEGSVGQRFRSAIDAAISTNTTGGRSKGAQLTKIKITQQNDEGNQSLPLP